MVIECAKAGTYGGNELTIAMMEEMAASFAGDVPVVIGHELADTMPAYGWVTSLRVEGDVLVGELELGDELKRCIEEGLYRSWSIGARQDDEGKWYLHHLAFLGAVPPRIRGLKILEMRDADSLVLFGGHAASATEATALKEELARHRHEAYQQRKEQFMQAVAQKIPAARLKPVLAFADRASETALAAEMLDVMEAVLAAIPAPVTAGEAVQKNIPAGAARTLFGKI